MKGPPRVGRRLRWCRYTATIDGNRERCQRLEGHDGAHLVRRFVVTISPDCGFSVGFADAAPAGEWITVRATA